MAAQHIKASFKYQLKDSLKAIAIFYIVIVRVYILLSTILVVNLSSGGVKISAAEAASSVGVIGGADGPTAVYVATSPSSGVVEGIGSATTIFLFVVGLCSFKEAFQLLLQNGVSRKGVFWGHVLAAGCIAAGMTVIDTILQTIALAIARAGFGSAVSTGQTVLAASGGSLGLAGNLLWTFCMYLYYYCLGYCITTLYYRLSRTGKILVSVGVPVLFMAGTPAFAYLLATNKGLGEWFFRLADQYGRFISNNPFFIVVQYFLGAALFSLLAWLLMRRAILRK